MEERRELWVSRGMGEEYDKEVGHVAVGSKCKKV